MKRVASIIAIRSAFPHITLQEAVLYSDPTTVQGRIFQDAGKGGFFGLGVDRETLAGAFAWYYTLWASERRNHVRGYSLSCFARLENADSEIKRCYGDIVRAKHSLLTGFERLARRAKKAGRPCPPWPGTRNMPWCGSEGRTISTWLRSEGLLGACEALAPADRGPAYDLMVETLKVQA